MPSTNWTQRRISPDEKNKASQVGQRTENAVLNRLLSGDRDIYTPVRSDQGRPPHAQNPQLESLKHKTFWEVTVQKWTKEALVGKAERDGP